MVGALENEQVGALEVAVREALWCTGDFARDQSERVADDGYFGRPRVAQAPLGEALCFVIQLNGVELAIERSDAWHRVDPLQPGDEGAGVSIQRVAFARSRRRGGDTERAIAAVSEQVDARVRICAKASGYRQPAVFEQRPVERESVRDHGRVRIRLNSRWCSRARRCYAPRRPPRRVLFGACEVFDRREAQDSVGFGGPCFASSKRSHAGDDRTRAR